MSPPSLTKKVSWLPRGIPARHHFLLSSSSLFPGRVFSQNPPPRSNTSRIYLPGKEEKEEIREEAIAAVDLFFKSSAVILAAPREENLASSLPPTAHF